MYTPTCTPSPPSPHLREWLLPTHTPKNKVGCEYHAMQCKPSTSKLLRQSMKQSAGPHAAPPLTKIHFDGRSPQLDGQILSKNRENDKIHVPQI